MGITQSSFDRSDRRIRRDRRHLSHPSKAIIWEEEESEEGSQQCANRDCGTRRIITSDDSSGARPGKTRLYRLHDHEFYRR